MDSQPWIMEAGDGPFLATAIHDGHEVRPEVAELLALEDADRLREEDPFTAHWTAVAPSRVVARRSRFEVDLNRPREKAVYLTPSDAWGLEVWRRALPGAVLARSLEQYDLFHERVGALIDALLARHPRIVVLDLHSYNHRRKGPGAPPDPTAENPDINLGTGTMPDRARWAALVDRFLEELSRYDYPGRRLDVRENVKFRGGHLARWLHSRYPDSVCVLSVEVKKFFMDEWTGAPDRSQLDAVGRALASTLPGLAEELARGAVRR